MPGSYEKKDRWVTNTKRRTGRLLITKEGRVVYQKKDGRVTHHSFFWSGIPFLDKTATKILKTCLDFVYSTQDNVHKGVYTQPL